jgi:hypothetical protein
MGWGFAAALGISALSSILSSGKKSPVKRKTTYAPVRLRLKDGTVVTMYQPTGDETSGGDLSKTDQILGAVGNAANSYAMGQAMEGGGTGSMFDKSVAANASLGGGTPAMEGAGGLKLNTGYSGSPYDNLDQSLSIGNKKPWEMG